MDDPSREEEERVSRRPRVVDKRVSARPDAREGTSREPAAPVSEPVEAPPPPAEPHAVAPPTGGPEDLWTPEQEEQARRVAQEVRDTPSRDWVLNVAVTLANVAATKLDSGLMGDAQLAIDALAGLVNAVGSRLGDAESALRSTVAQLQMAYAQAAQPPGPATG